MTKQIKFDYPQEAISRVLMSATNSDTYYGLDKFESRRLNILMAKYRCRNKMQNLPAHLTTNLYPFIRDVSNDCYRIDLSRMVPVQMNQLREFRVMFAVR